MKRSARTEPAHSHGQQARPKLGHGLTEILMVTYGSAMLRRVADAASVSVRSFSAPDIPSAILEAIVEERADALGGIHGDPSWGKPIQYDRLVIGHRGHQTDITVYNRAIQLFKVDSETVRRIHRLCEVVRKVCDGPG